MLNIKLSPRCLRLNYFQRTKMYNNNINDNKNSQTEWNYTVKCQITSVNIDISYEIPSDQPCVI